MSLWRRLWSGEYREARRAESRGAMREAAALYVEAGAEEEAARALIAHARRVEDADEAMSAYEDALRWLSPSHRDSPTVRGELGQLILTRAEEEGVHAPAERRRLGRGAVHLEEAGEMLAAADAYEKLEEWDDAARCLTRAGAVERLEGLLSRTGAEHERRQEIDSLVASYRTAMETGARGEARDALERAASLAPEDEMIGSMLLALARRRLGEGRVRLAVGGQPVWVFDRLPLVVGREAPLTLRGTTISRRHAELDSLDGGGVRVRDLGSRNGTSVRGVPIADTLESPHGVEIDLGDGVALGIEGEGSGLRIEILSGFDRGLLAYAGLREVELAEGAVTVSFADGSPVLEPSGDDPLLLSGKPCAVGIELLREDVIQVGNAVVEVLD